MRSAGMVPSTASRVVIRVEQYSNGCLSGLLHNPYLDAIERFSDVLDLTGKLDGMFDDLSFPQAAMQYRSFERKKGAPPPAQRAALFQPGSTGGGWGAAAQAQAVQVFFVHVQFRQHATWQGTIQWENRQPVRFRSTLEMLKIMDKALMEKQAEKEETE